MRSDAHSRRCNRIAAVTGKRVKIRAACVDCLFARQPRGTGAVRRKRRTVCEKLKGGSCRRFCAGFCVPKLLARARPGHPRLKAAKICASGNVDGRTKSGHGDPLWSRGPPLCKPAPFPGQPCTFRGDEIGGTGIIRVRARQELRGALFATPLSDGPPCKGVFCSARHRPQSWTAARSWSGLAEILLEEGSR
jgi:hypothetical protein